MLVQKLRLQHGWSQQQLADLSGLSVRTIQRIERGQTPSTESLKSLAAVFETDFLNLKQESIMSSPLQPGISAEEYLAFEHVRKVKRFYLHVVKYLIVVSLLAVLNYVQIVFYNTPRGGWWVQWVALGWGIGLISHGVGVFQLLPFFGAEWEKREVEKRLGRPL